MKISFFHPKTRNSVRIIRSWNCSDFTRNSEYLRIRMNFRISGFSYFFLQRSEKYFFRNISNQKKKRKKYFPKSSLSFQYFWSRNFFLGLFILHKVQWRKKNFFIKFEKCQKKEKVNWFFNRFLQTIVQVFTVYNPKTSKLFSFLSKKFCIYFAGWLF